MGHTTGFYKDIDNSNNFKNKMEEKWKPENCPFRPCKVYSNNIGFVWEWKRNSVVLGEIFLFVASTRIFLNLFNLLFLACLWVHSLS